MKFLKLLIPFIFVSKLFLSHSMALTCDLYLETNQTDFHREWEEFILTRPETDTSIRSRAEIETYFINTLVTNYISSYRPDLVSDRELVQDLISETVHELRNALEFYRAIIHARFESSKKYLDNGVAPNMTLYHSEIEDIKRLILSLNKKILLDLSAY